MARRLPYLLLAVTILCSSCATSRATANKAAYHFQMGQSLYAENNITGALAEFAEAEKLTPRDPELLNYLGLSYYRKGRFDLAVEKYRAALEIKPTYSEVRNNLGVDYLDMKRWDDAIREFQKVLDDIFFTGQEDVQINLGLAYLGKGEFDQALTVLRPVVAKNPGNPRGRLSLGRVYFAMEKTELAAAEFQKALESNPSYANAYYNLALARVKLKDSAGARAAFKEVIRLAPDSEIGQLSREYLDALK
ncbi:tetratricopeptide repeat protein [Geomesophilobacter sediminis]|uniref:Tetratricopeptide repeat protein n=1 Tax=Geomesophilobacter sediminis TaxID=2798584 RepID=A0A8J7JFY6_9BACT|nr:tetratricopeptide repeat protein [Geomesophilobacter sediminis]MBJ6723210.1 tetratricopeptide repeat protein [Geomesophilobacter sediminis]